MPPIPGVLTRLGVSKFEFVESAPIRYRPNPKVYQGRYCSVTTRKDGSYRINLNPVSLNADFNPHRFAISLYEELKKARRELVRQNASDDVADPYLY